MRKVPRVILLIESSRSSGRSLLRGITEYARHHGPWAFLWEPAGLEKAWPRLRGSDADGVILRDTEPVADIIGRGLPAVVIGHNKPEVPGIVNVVTDSDAIGTMAAEHLLQCGFRHFAYCGFGDKPWSVRRGESFRRRLEQAGFAPRFYCSGRAALRSTSETEQPAMVAWLEELPKPLGVMACNDDRGQHVIEACKIAGLHVPDQVAVIGADNDELVCELADPPLSSVAIHFERAGWETAQALDRLMTRRAARTRKIVVRATHVVARQSTDILTMEDPHIVKALRFIRQHVTTSMRVSEVAAASGLSRRVLEKRFRRKLGRSILHEIRGARVAQICRMLVETNEPIAQVAAALGFDTVEHIARYFRREKHMTPLAYRKQFGRR